jgi:PAS domain S-box-containing protein
MQFNTKIFESLQQVFIEPPSRISDIALRYKSRLLNLFLLPMILIFVAVDSFYLVTLPGYQPPWYGYIFLIGSYLLNKSGRYSIAALLTIAMFPIVILANNITGESSNPLTTLYYLIPGLILAGILLSIHATALFALLEIAVILSMPYVASNAFEDFSALIGPLSAMVISAVLVLVSMKARDQIETDRQAKLRDSEERLRLALDAAQMGTWNWNIETGAVSWSERIEPLFGMKQGEFNGNYDTYLSLIHPEDLPDVQNAIENALADKGADYSLEHRIISSNGEISWLEGRGKVYRNIKGKPVRMVGTVVDITDRKCADEALRRSEARTRVLLDAVPDMIFEFKRDGTILQFVPSATGRPLLPPEEFLGKTIKDVLPVSVADQTTFAIERVLDSGQVHAFEYQLQQGGETKTFEARITPLSSDTVVAMVRDVSLQRWIQSEREKLIAELERKNMELERFTYTASHDLKSPLITIKGVLGFLREDAAHGNLKRLETDIQRISDATDKMQHLLNDLLELSRIGRSVNKIETINLNGMIAEVIELLHGRLSSGALPVRVSIQENLPEVYGDRSRLLEVWQNLIDNAAKFMGDQPDPHIEIGQAGTSDEGLHIFFVRDNGIGINPKFSERIFGLFDKLDPRTEGTGIGLALVKRIIEFHGGRVWVESEITEGATFYFTLPASEISFENKNDVASDVVTHHPPAA